MLCIIKSYVVLTYCNILTNVATFFQVFTFTSEGGGTKLCKCYLVNKGEGDIENIIHID